MENATKMQVPVRNLIPGDIVCGNSAIVMQVVRGVRTPSGNHEVVMNKDGNVKVSVWGSSTNIWVWRKN